MPSNNRNLLWINNRLFITIPTTVKWLCKLLENNAAECATAPVVFRYHGKSFHSTQTAEIV